MKKEDLKFILKSTTASVTEKGEVQNWELIPKKNELLDVKEKENIVDANQVSRTKKRKVKKSNIEPDKIETVVTKSRFGRSRTLKKYS